MTDCMKTLGSVNNQMSRVQWLQFNYSYLATDKKLICVTFTYRKLKILQENVPQE